MRHLFTLILAAGLASLVSAADTPNFIVINIDDLGYADIGPFGSTLNRTPNLDRMAAEGRKLTSHYAAPVCSPSRSALMTGCYPKRVLPIPSVLFPASEVGLNPEEMTVAEVLKTRGYATGCIGKWHLGDQPGMLPNDQGFDYYYGIPYSNDMGTRAEGSKSNPGEEPKQSAAPKNSPAKKKAPQASDETGLRGDTQPPLPLLENHTVIERVKQNGQTTITQRYTEKAVGFIREHREGPFFLYLPHTAVHFPLYPGMEYRGKSKNGLIGDWVEEVDWSVGQVLDAVRELGLSENTLVVFTSDNGGTTRSVNTPLRGNKGSTLEGGIRVCTIAWWPGKIPAGTATDAMTSMMDILPTFAGLAGAEVPSDRKIDGVDIWPVMTGEARPREVFHYFRGLKLEAVRRGPWKLHLENGELYNLDSDIGEATNVAEANPDRVKELRSLADGMTDDLGLTEVGKGCRPMGRYPNPLPLISHDGTIRAGFEPKP
ncbi:MAG: sulfatase [Verrucomicrobiae bacterium]|nr:sulfatase [Verrucomicrobiae bacterium]